MADNDDMTDGGNRTVVEISPETERPKETEEVQTEASKFAIKTIAKVLVTDKMIKNLLSRAKVSINPTEWDIKVHEDSLTVILMFSSKEDAEKAIQELEGQQLKKKHFLKEVIEIKKT